MFTAIHPHRDPLHHPLFLAEQKASKDRARRVTVLLVGIVVLSMVDLVMTLSYLRTIGMHEANPIAVMVINSTNSAFSLSCFKVLTVLVATWSMFRIRTHLAGEVAAWLGLVILTALSVQWHLYAAHFAEPEALSLVFAGAYDDIWVRLD